jgi:hypothetical protein
MAIIDLTTTARVRSLLGLPDDDTSADTNVGRLITSASARIERYLRRGIDTIARTETFDVMHGRYTYALGAYPVTSVASVKVATNYDFASATAKTSGADYHVDLTAGVVEQLTTWLAGPRVLQVVYTAGLAANTAAVLASYPDLTDACEKQVVEEHNRRGGMLRKSANVGGATESSESVTLIPIVREILAPYRRPVL